MRDFVVASHTDVGIKKKINQDSICIEIADTDIGYVGLLAVCDGMGGLMDGERASAMMVKRLCQWFEHSLAASICKNGSLLPLEDFRAECDFLIRQVNKEIQESMSQASGTTLCASLFASGTYYTVNVGDSRAYKLSNGELTQLTKDQTLVQQLIDKGEITPEEAKTHPRRSVLLQCVGASELIIPEYTEGTYNAEDVFLLCSDGFRHVITKEEFEDALYIEDGQEDEYQAMLKQLTELNMRRGEKDNISAVVLRILDGERFS